MNGVWTAFAVIMAFVAAILGWQVFNNPSSLILMLLGMIFLLIKSSKKRHNPKSADIFGVTGLILLFLGLGQNISFWFLLLLTLFFGMILFGNIAGWPKTRQHLSELLPWNHKSYIAPKNRDKDTNAPKCKINHWLGDRTIGENIYTWDDINLSILAGDTIIDLGNTLLDPDKENIILLRKGFGRTRILVPVGTKVRIKHSAIFGELTIDSKNYPLKNQTIELTQSNEENSRELRIITSVLIGDLEVIYV